MKSFENGLKRSKSVYIGQNRFKSVENDRNRSKLVKNSGGCGLPKVVVVEVANWKIMLENKAYISPSSAYFMLRFADACFVNAFLMAASLLMIWFVSYAGGVPIDGDKDNVAFIHLLHVSWHDNTTSYTKSMTAATSGLSTTMTSDPGERDARMIESGLISLIVCAFSWETLTEGTEGALHLGPERPRVYFDLTIEEKERYNADIRATNILLQGLPKDIYYFINHYTDAKDIWDNVKMLLEGSKLTKEDRESQLYDDFEHFRQNKGETIHDCYVLFAKLINDMRNIKMPMSRMQLNSKDGAEDFSRNIVTNSRVTLSWKEIVSLTFSEAGVLHVNWTSLGHCV
nr:hypothetical protein [Tanacetum cinerariifolium]